MKPKLAIALVLVAALPFLGASLAGDLVWIAALSLAYRPLARRLAARGGWVPAESCELAAI
jgi:hypothetical protein